MQPTRTRAVTKAATFDRRRWLLSWLMALAVLVVSLASALSVHAAPNGDLTIGGQVMKAETVFEKSPAAVQDTAPDMGLGDAVDCTDHCASHGLTLPAALAPADSVLRPIVAWRPAVTLLMPDGAAARLERPPRL